MNKNNKFSQETISKLRSVDIKTVEKEELVDINDIQIRTELPVEERVRDFMQQIGNPYCYLDHGMIVKISFSGKAKLEDCLKSAVLAERNSHIC